MREYIERVIFTTAVEAYDYPGVVVEELEAFECGGRTWRKVKMVNEPYRIENQIMRYASGLCGAWDEDPRVAEERHRVVEEKWRALVAEQKAQIDAIDVADDLERYFRRNEHCLDYKAKAHARERIDALAKRDAKAEAEAKAKEIAEATPKLPNIIFIPIYHNMRFCRFEMSVVKGFDWQNNVKVDGVSLSAASVIAGEYVRAIPWWGDMPPQRLFRDHAHDFQSWERVTFEGEAYYRVGKMFTYPREYIVYDADGKKVRRSMRRLDLFSQTALEWTKIFDIPSHP